jgi:hypothetical protein
MLALAAANRERWLDGRARTRTTTKQSTREGQLLSKEDLLESIGELEALIAARVPRAFVPPEASWPLVATAFIARFADILRSIALLVDQRQEADALMLVRAAYEHVVMFCWIAADPDTRLEEWVEHSERGRLVQVAEADRLFGVPPPQELDPDDAADLERLRPLAQLAREADDHWSMELAAFRRVERDESGLLTLTGFYTAVYRRISRAAHAEAEFVDAVVEVLPSQ